MNNTSTQHLYHILKTPSQNVQLYDESDGLFGDLIDANSVIHALASLSSSSSSSSSTNVGSFNSSDNQAAPNICSQSYYASSSSSAIHNDELPDIPLEIDNVANVPVRIRYINVNGQCPVGQTFTVDAYSSTARYVGMGHCFLLSVVLESKKNDSGNNDGGVGMLQEREEVLAAYRVRRRLPSGSCHCIFIQQQQQQQQQVDDGGQTTSPVSSFITEILLMDETKYDALVVSAAALHHDIQLHHRQQQQQHGNVSNRQATISTLHKIISNVIKQPQNQLYRTLRVKNKRVQREILSSFGAMEMLRVLGFRKEFRSKHDEYKSKEETGEKEEIKEEEEVLKRVNAPSPIEMETFHNAIKLLDILKERSHPNFVEELSQPPPWSIFDPSLGGGPAAAGGAGGGWTARRGGFNIIDDEERWRRAERNSRMRRSGGHGRRPNPGEAPSSRGRWGR